MKVRTVIFTIMIMIVFLFGFSASYAVTPIVSTKSHPSGTKNEVMKSSHFVKKIENNMIYLENNKKYSLNGVTVTNLTATNRISQKKTMAELMFVKGELKEVILR